MQSVELVKRVGLFIVPGSKGVRAGFTEEVTPELGFEK